MKSTIQRAARLFIIAILMLSVVGVASPTLAASTSASTTPVPAQASTATVAQANNTTSTAGPTTASQVRVTPDIPDADYVSIETSESDEVFNTSGTFATFSLTQPVESVRVAQPGADASILGGGSVVRVEYASDAAPRDQQSLYTLELFFDDGSKKEVKLYASNTAVSAKTEIDPAYLAFIEYVSENAEDEGYETSPDGLEDYVAHKEDRAQLLEGLWSKQIETFIGLRIAQLFSPLDWVAGLVAIALVAVFASRKHGWVLRAQQVATSKAELVREAVRQDYEKSRNAAAKHSLEDVDGIGRNDARFWRNVGIETVDDMIQVSCKGIVAVDESGHIEQDEKGRDVYEHHGVLDLQKADPMTEKALREKTWLKPVIVEGRLRATTALSNIERALLTAEREYARGNEVRETRMKVEEMVAELRGDRDFADQKTSTYGPRAIESRESHDTPGSGTGAD